MVLFHDIVAAYGFMRADWELRARFGLCGDDVSGVWRCKLFMLFGRMELLHAL